MPIEAFLLLSNGYAIQLGMKGAKGTADRLGGVWEGEGSFGSATQGIISQNLFVHFASPNSHLLEEMAQEFSRLGLKSRR